MATQTRTKTDSGGLTWRLKRPQFRFHAFMFATSGTLLAICIAGSWITSHSGWSLLAPVAAVIPVAALPAILRHDRQEYYKRDAALTLPWAVVLTVLIPWAAVLQAQVFHFPLRDPLYISLDRSLGFSVPAIVTWTSTHPFVNTLFDRSYALLFTMLPVATVLPPLLGRREAAERFLLANTISFLAALPIFAMLPAVGPWAGYHFAPSAAQQACQASIAALRAGHESSDVGIVCFPSFHVIWAVLSAVAVSSIRPLRIPASILAAMIVISTVTTGWHYVVDVFAGLIVAGASLILADSLMRRFRSARAWPRHAAVEKIGAQS